MRKSILAALLLVTVGCSIQEVAEETRSAVQDSNALQEKILQRLKKTQDVTEALQTETEKMAAAVHLQILTVALEQMFAPRNTESLSPPIRMSPFAKIFAEEATPLELMEISYVLLTDAADSAEVEASSRLVSLVGMTVIATFTPEEKVSHILMYHAEHGSRFRDTAYSFALVRYIGIRDYQFLPLIEKSKYLGLGALEEAVVQFGDLQFLRGLPYVDRLVLKLPALEVDSSIDKSELVRLGKKAHRRFTADLEVPGVQAQKAAKLMKAFEVETP